jgi:catechol 2,3-dioxygenase-like lactoylglutathione lyase family enzyme
MSVKSAVTMLNVADIDRAVAFYRDGLGLHVVTHTPHWSELTAGPARIALHPGGNGARKDSGINFEVDDLEADCARCASVGGVIEKAPEHRPSQRISIATVRDPEGNVFYLAQPLGGKDGGGWS